MASDTIAPVVLVGRAELRRRWPGIVLVGLMFGLAAGIAVASVAGARRTASVFERHLDATDAPDIEIDPGNVTPEAEAALRSLPGVTDASYWVVYSAYPLTPEGSIDLATAGAIVFTTDGRYVDNDRLVASEGRLLDASNPGEVMINQSYADATGVGVGDTFTMGVVASDGDGMPLTMDPPPADQIEVTVVGIMVLNEEITSEAIDIVPRVFLSPAARRPPMGDSNIYGFAWYALEVEGGEQAVDLVESTWQRLADEHNASADTGEAGSTAWLTYTHRTSDLERKASRSVRPLVTSLATFGLLVLLAAIVLVSQSLSRSVRLRRTEAGVTRVLGLSPTQVFGVSMIVPVATIALGSVAAMITSVLASGVYPVGPYAVLEPAKGIRLDLLVLLPGLALMALIPLGVVALVAWREVRSWRALGNESGNVGAVTRWSTRTGRFPSLAAAVRMTIDPGHGRRFVPTRSVLVSTTITIIALVTVVVFGSNLRALADDPARFGWPADAAAASDGGYGPFDDTALAEVLDNSPEVASWRPVGVGLTVINGQRIPSALFGDGDPDLAPTMVDGHPPHGAGELVLGKSTLARLGVSIGDEVTVGEGDQARQMEVTGTAVFPVLGPVLATRTGLDRGAWYADADYRQFDAISAMISFGLPDRAYYSFALINLTDGGSLDRLAPALRDTPGVSMGSSVDVFDLIRPSEVRTAADGAGRTQTLLSVALAVAAGISTLIALAAVVRRRRSELAVYRVLGFNPRQVRATVIWQGLLMTGTSALVGVPLGIVLGRSLWRAFADRLGVVPDPTVPVVAMLVAAAVAVGVGLIGAIVPALIAARVSPAAGLRSE